MVSDYVDWLGELFNWMTPFRCNLHHDEYILLADLLSAILVVEN